MFAVVWFSSDKCSLAVTETTERRASLRSVVSLACDLPVSVPQEHLTGSAVGVLLKRVHLEVVLVGRGSLRLDIGAVDIKTRLFPMRNLSTLHTQSEGFFFFFFP